MAAYNDPTVCHPGECIDCGRAYRDRDNLDDNGRCPDCAEEAKDEDEDA